MLDRHYVPMGSYVLCDFCRLRKPAAGAILVQREFELEKMACKDCKGEALTTGYQEVADKE